MRFRAALPIALLLLLPAAAARAATISIEPADTSVTVGDTLALRVVCSPVADLKGYELVHAFDASRLASITVRAGDVLVGTGRPYAAYVLPDAVAPVDSTWLDAAMLDGATSGPGVLAYLVFKATATGTAAVTCEHAELRDSSNAAIPGDCAGAVVRVSAAVPVRRTTWGGLKSRYR